MTTTRHSLPVDDDETARLHTATVLPRAHLLIEAFNDRASVVHPARTVLNTANQLANLHLKRRHCHDLREMAAIDKACDGIVQRFDRWVAQNVYCRVNSSLHTETLGAVIDRLAEYWVATPHNPDLDAAATESSYRLWRLAELRCAYDDLIDDIAAGQRRLPVAQGEQ